MTELNEGQILNGFLIGSKKIGSWELLMFGEGTMRNHIVKNI